jgi:hypothetical protein
MDSHRLTRWVDTSGLGEQWGGRKALVAVLQVLRPAGQRLGWRIRKRQARSALRRALSPNPSGVEEATRLTWSRRGEVRSASLLDPSPRVAALLVRATLVSCYTQVRARQRCAPLSERSLPCLVALDRLWRRRTALARALPLLAQRLPSTAEVTDVRASELDVATIQVLRRLAEVCTVPPGLQLQGHEASAGLYPPHVYVQVMRWAVERVCTVHASRLILIRIGGEALLQQLPALYRTAMRQQLDSGQDHLSAPDRGHSRSFRFFQTLQHRKCSTP